MVNIDYETPPPPIGFFRRLFHQVILAAKILLGIIGGGFVTLILSFLVMEFWATHKLNQRVNESVVLGKTATQIISAAGTPDDDQTDSNGNRNLTYAGSGVYCRVEIRNGVGVNIVRWSK